VHDVTLTPFRPGDHDGGLSTVASMWPGARGSNARSWPTCPREKSYRL